jgi:hypothetical protein
MASALHPRYNAWHVTAGGYVMSRSRFSLALCTVVATAFAPTGAAAQQKNDQPLVDFSPLVPPVFPLPPSSTLTPGAIGNPQRSPYTTAPLQDPASSVRDRESAPGLKLTIPTR